MRAHYEDFTRLSPASWIGLTGTELDLQRQTVHVQSAHVSN